MARMARTIGPLICIFLMAMDIVAGILSIEADVAQNRVSFSALQFTGTKLLQMIDGYYVFRP